MNMHPAQFYSKSGELSVTCELCPHRCIIGAGKTGRCHVRENVGGELFARMYGVVPSLSLDPIEKKPLYHFHPGSFILSAGGFGCNLSCRFCQNYEISQTGGPPDAATITSETLVTAALDALKRKNIGIAYTYNEPLVNYEFVYDTAVLAHRAALKNVLVTNGFINPEPMKKLLPFIDAMNIDLKAFTDSFYKKICGGHLDPVLSTISLCVPSCHIEVTTLVIPGSNSDPAEIDALASWLASVSPEIPLHLNRHHPSFLMAEPAPISREALLALGTIARAHLKYVHCGNIPDPIQQLP